jgi:hypothetical protein
MRRIPKNNIFWVSEDVTINEIKKNGCKGILSVYGSVITEATYAGLVVITAGRSKFSGFNVSYRAHSLLEYSELLEMASLGLLMPKSKDEAVLAEFAVNEMPKIMKKRISMPFNDISEEFWAEANLGSYPSSYQERRNFFLKSERVKTYMKKLVSKINISNQIDIQRIY